MDINEGADMIMVKPGMPYLDIIKILKIILKYQLFLTKYQESLVLLKMVLKIN